jgi:thioredoxin-dependent peroxiredoxin
MAKPTTGDIAPDFTLPDQDGNEVTLSELRGRPVVLYFYPKADTPGCTTQACGIRDHRGDYERAGARVVGVSPDTVTAQRKFAEKYDLDFTLLADEDHSVAELYGVWGEKKMYGKMRGRASARPVSRWGVQRATFIIDPEGTVAHVIPKASPKTHDEVVLEALGELTSA